MSAAINRNANEGRKQLHQYQRAIKVIEFDTTGAWKN